MKKETEITVTVKTDYESLKRELEKNGFEIKDDYELHDEYLIPNDVDLKNTPKLEILQKCVLVRDVVGIEKTLMYKYKKFAPNGDILEQGKVRCPVVDIDKAINFMEYINYKRLFHIYDHCIEFKNDETELIVQLVNDKYIFIEMEAQDENTTTDELKEMLNKYNLPIDTSNYFVKKAELMLEGALE